MIAWMMYIVLVTLTLSAAGIAAERAATVRGPATRWVWMAMLVGSLVLPIVIASASIRLPDAFNSSNASTSIVLRDTTSIQMPTVLLDGEARSYASSAHIDMLMRGIWAGASALMSLFLVLSSVLLNRRKRGWSEERLCGEHVFVAPDAGPAVVGFIRSRILVPSWLLQSSQGQQQCAIAHERSHLDARDPQLLGLALILLTLMPWNPLLWWQFRRLRRAIEMDCDARVLLGGHDVGAYCEALIHVGQRQSSRIGVVPAMSDSGSFLELRIRQMLRKPKKWAHVSAVVLIGVSLGMAVIAAQVTPPDTDHRDANNPVLVSGVALARYIGFYRVSPVSLVTVTRANNGLTVSISGQIAAPKPFHIVPLGETRFAVEGMDATVRFITDAAGHPLRLVAQQNGRDVLDALRIDKTAADRINAALAARIKAQKPFAGSERALRLLLSDPDSGAGMSADLARIRTEKRAAREKYLADLGPIESYGFTGVSKFGSDTYLVKHRQGTETVLLVLDTEGTLATAFRHR